MFGLRWFGRDRTRKTAKASAPGHELDGCWRVEARLPIDCGSKAAANARTHGIQFAEAVLVLEDERASTLRDDAQIEERWVTIGMDAVARVLTVVYTWRGDIIRIVPVRTATPSELTRYLENS